VASGRGVAAASWRQGEACHFFALAASLVLTGGFSLAHRKADRYIFAVYFFVAAVGAIDAVNRFAWLRRVVERLDRPWVPAAFHVGLVILRLLTLHQLPEFTFWRS
jgi:hypothetical protein